MEVSFVPTTTRRPFSMQVGYFETIQEIKEKIQKIHKIPAEKQTLILNDQTLQDHLNIYLTDIDHNSIIQLIISGDDQESTPPPPPPPATTSTSTSTSCWSNYPTSGTTPTISEFGSLVENFDPYESWLQEMGDFDNSTIMLLEEPTTTTTIKVNQDSVSGELGSSMENIDPLESWLLEVEQESKPSPEKATTVKVNQESTMPPPPPPPPATSTATRVTTFSELGISPENTNQSKTWTSWLSEMDLIDNSNYKHGKFPLNIASPATTTATPSKKITLFLKMLSTAINGMPIELEINDSIRRLKEKIFKDIDKGIPVEKLIVRSNGVELHDHNTLHECGLLDQSEIEISIKRTPPATSSSKATTNNTNNNKPQNPRIPKIPKAPKKLKIFVVTMYETKTIPLEVNAWDKVEELRKELDKVNQREPLNLSQEGFFFIHRQAVMYEDKSFEWHNVRPGDKIDIFNGRITEGS